MKKAFGVIKTSVIVFIIAFIVIFIVGFIPDEDGEYIFNPFDYARITEIDYKAKVVDEVGSRGQVVITEKLTFDIHAAFESNLFWELWRDLPEEYIDGVKVEYKVKSVKQIFDDKPPVIYTESRKLYWNDSDYTSLAYGLGPGKWYHSKGPYDGEYNFECLLIYVDGLYRETVTFEIEYIMYNAALRWEDSSELYLSFYADKMVKYLKSFKGQILFPEDKMPKAGNYDAYTYGTNSHSFPFTESSTKNPGYYTFSFELDETNLKFKPYNEYIEFALISYGEDKHKFTKYATKNVYYNDEALDELRQEQKNYEALPEKYKTLKIITFFLALASNIFVIKFVLDVDKKMKKKHKFYESDMKMDYFRDIPSNLDPIFASELVFSKHKLLDNMKDGYAAVMLSLVCKGYIQLDKIKNEGNWDSKNVKIIIKYQPTLPLEIGNDDIAQDIIKEQQAPNIKSLTQTEELYFKLILRHSKGNDITFDLFNKKVSSDYAHTNSFINNVKRAIKNIGVTQGYFQKANYKSPRNQIKGWGTLFALVGILLITVGNLISYQTRLELAFGAFFILGIGFVIGAINLNKLSGKYILLTKFGEDEYSAWRGLYNFLNSMTLMNERTVIEITLWEQYLVYATAFGISKKVIDALEVRCNETIINSSPILSNPYYRSRSFYSSSHSFRSATRTATYTARSGGHGGYGGGGRGGGGGGGGH